MGHGRIGEDQPETRKEQHGRKADAFGVRAGNQGHGQDREHALEGHKNGMRQIGGGRSGRALNPVQKKVGKVTDHTAEVIAEGQGVAHQGPEHGDQPQAGVTVHVGGKHIARPNQAAVKQGQRRGHQHDHCGADDDKSRIRSVHPKLPCGRCRPQISSLRLPGDGKRSECAAAYPAGQKLRGWNRRRVLPQRGTCRASCCAPRHNPCQSRKAEGSDIYYPNFADYF